MVRGSPRARRACVTDSKGFNRYRGTGWMKEPCSSCEHREQDLGGCRCQADLIAQDAQAADPVCRLSPHHDRVLEAVQRTEANAARGVIEHPLLFRDPVNSRWLATTAR